MNNTNSFSAKLRSAKRATSYAAVAPLVSQDLSVAAPTAGKPYQGEITIEGMFKTLHGMSRYWAQETYIAAIATVLMLALSFILPFLFAPSLALTGVLAFTITAAAIAGYQWIFRKWGPNRISEDRLIQAKKELADSGDEHHVPVELLEMLVLVAIMTIDGFLSGSSLVDSVFSSIFNARMALIAAVAWGVAATFLLHKLLSSAVTEGTINERRDLIRQLSSSSDVDDQAKAVAMKKAVGGKLGNNFATTADRHFARISLAVCVLVLSGSTFLLRTNTPADAPANAAPTFDAAPAVMQPAFLRV